MAMELSSHTNKLPSEQHQRLHADFLANEQAYLRLRGSLLPQFRGQWVAVHGGRVIAAGTDLMSVTEAAASSGGHPYIALVGAEDAVVFRVRRVAYPYDTAYQPFPLPQLTATFGTTPRLIRGPAPMLYPIRAPISVCYRMQIARLSIFTIRRILRLSPAGCREPARRR